MTHKILFLNGPPRSGKDTLGRTVFLEFNARQHKMAEPLGAGVPAMFGIHPDRWRVMREAEKDVPQADLMGWTPRQAMIWLSEEVMKPRFGDDIFGRIATNELAKMQTTTELTIITDSGFKEECVPVVKKFGNKNCFLVRLHRDGCSYVGDSRSYLDLSDYGVNSFDFDNNSDIKDKIERGLSLVEMRLIRVVKNGLNVLPRREM
jgi:hypothetical protein